MTYLILKAPVKTRVAEYLQYYLHIWWDQFLLDIFQLGQILSIFTDWYFFM